MAQVIKWCFTSLCGTLYDLYWRVYKSQLPPNCRCLDDGPEFVAKLSLLGKILHFFRPALTRHRKRGTYIQHIPKSPKQKIREHVDAFYDPTKSRVYYSLISHSLQIPNEQPFIHINVSDFSLIHFGSASAIEISHYLQNMDVISQWLTDNARSYIFTIDHSSFPDFHLIPLCDSISSVLTVQNAGGSSEYSEIASMQYMNVCFHSINFVPEMLVKYEMESKICDYITTINSINVGVSVTRMFIQNFSQIIPLSFAISLLYKKLMGIVIAKKTISSIHRFSKSIVHIWCQSYIDALVVKLAYKHIISHDVYYLFTNICVICSVCTSKFIYSNSL